MKKRNKKKKTTRTKRSKEEKVNLVKLSGGDKTKLSHLSANQIIPRPLRINKRRERARDHFHLRQLPVCIHRYMSHILYFFTLTLIKCETIQEAAFIVSYSCLTLSHSKRRKCNLHRQIQNMIQSQI